MSRPRCLWLWVIWGFYFAAIVQSARKHRSLHQSCVWRNVNVCHKSVHHIYPWKRQYNKHDNLTVEHRWPGSVYILNMKCAIDATNSFMCRDYSPETKRWSLQLPLINLRFLLIFERTKYSWWMLQNRQRWAKTRQYMSAGKRNTNDTWTIFGRLHVSARLLFTMAQTRYQDIWE